ncbi:MAG: hypothetical protein IJE78_06195 [Bacteroidaceae bacterium]|nr:hypothetical protein [Bacteroidaceae bacterium]
MSQKYDLRCEFDLQKHKETFVNYLEVIITSDGVVHYAVPSHQEYMIMLAMKQYNWTREDLKKAIPADYYSDFMIWLSKITQSISVWTDFLVFYELNPAQYEKLLELKQANLYNGYMPSRPMTIEEYQKEKYERFEGTDGIW